MACKLIRKDLESVLYDKLVQLYGDEIAIEKAVQLLIIEEILLLLAPAQSVERRLANVDMAAFNQRQHLPVKKGKQEGTDMSAIHIGIGHNDYFVIAQLFQVEFFLANTSAQRSHQLLDLL